jgi:hypothetical protein
MVNSLEKSGTEYLLNDKEKSRNNEINPEHPGMNY